MHKELNAEGKSDEEANIIVKEFLDGMSHCFMYSLVSLPKDVGEHMYKDIADGINMRIAKDNAEKRWLTLVEDGKFTKEQVFERVERSDVIRVICNKKLKTSLSGKYHLRN
ncbi:hypothetical protein GCM10022421_16260 [Oceanisphaera sediminis]|uniref:Uncharacterized protein n=1 Tax=Oceanisphaera sediminis TaxID=981381 RepID=A0ABP7DVV5_9GAMM